MFEHSVQGHDVEVAAVVIDAAKVGDSGLPVPARLLETVFAVLRSPFSGDQDCSGVTIEGTSWTPAAHTVA